MIIDDADFNTVLRKALEADPETTAKVLAIGISGCETIDAFQAAMKVAREAPFSPDSTPEEFTEALDAAEASFSQMLDIFGEMLEVATGALNRGQG